VQFSVVDNNRMRLKVRQGPKFQGFFSGVPTPIQKKATLKAR